MPEQKNGDIFSSFMKSGSDSSKQATPDGGKYQAKSAKERLQEIKEEEKRKEQEETEEAKKESIFKASRINQSMVTKRQAQQNAVLYVIIGAIALLLTLAIFKLAPRFSDLTSFLFQSAIGVK